LIDELVSSAFFPLQYSFQRKGTKVTQSSQRIRTTFHLAPSQKKQAHSQPLKLQKLLKLNKERKVSCFVVAQGLAIRYYSYGKNQKTQKNQSKNYSTKNYTTKQSYNAAIEAILHGQNDYFGRASFFPKTKKA